MVTNMKMNKKLLSMAIGATLAAASQTSMATLPAKVKFNFDAGVKNCVIGTDTTTTTGCLYDVTSTTGSWFSMDSDGNGVTDSEKTVISQNNGVILGQTQPASGSHSGAPNGSESPDIDNPWGFFTNTGMHQTTSAVTMLSDDGAGNVTLDMAGWSVTWNGIADIPMGGDTANFGTDTGIATVTCAVDCAAGDTYTLEFAAHVPLGDPSSFGGVPYVLHLEGTIVDLNQAPTAASATLSSSVTPNGSIRVDATGNVSDPDGDGIDTASVQVTYAGGRSPVPTLDVCTAASTPHALCQAEGDIVYTDNVGTDTVSSDTFTYTLTDTLGASLASPVTVNMDVVTGNLPPACNGTTLATNLGTPINVTVPNYASDSDGTIDVTSVATSNAVNGTAGVPTAAGVVTFTSASAGTASFDYTIDDDVGATCPSAGTITINVNDLPVANDDTSITVDRNSIAGVLIDVPVNDTDSDGTLDKTTVNIVSDVTNGITSVDGTTGKVTYTPNTSYLGADSFIYTIDDDLGGTSNTATVSIDVVNALPVAVNDSASVDTALVASVDINVLANDSDSDGTIDNASVVATQGTNGSTSVGLMGVVTYTPNGGYVGTDTFTYTVADNDGETSNATVNISVSSSAIVGFPDAAYLVIEAASIDNNVIKPAAGIGSWFSMETSPGSFTYVPIQGYNQLQEGTTQAAFSGSNVDGVNIPASPNIDNVWTFFGNSGVHQTTSAANELTDDGNGNVTMDLSGWNVSWNGIASIPMNSNATVAGFADGIAKLTCAVDCNYGDTYVLEYSATVPDGDASGFGNVHYFLHLEGTVAESAGVIGGANTAAAYDVTETSAVDDGGLAVTVVPGTTADSVGNTTGINLTSTDVGLKDPKLNVNDGAQCVGGCIDFYVTGVTPGGYVDIVVYLSEAIPEGASYRKLMNGVWQDFDTSQGDLVGSATATAGACQGPDGVFAIGLRAGNQCLFLRITDGGANDADGIADGTIVDPSGVLVAGSANVPASSTDGCSVSNVPVKLTERADWLLVAAFIAGFGLLTYRRRERNIR